MAAFYYDKITITRNPANTGEYDFKAESNPTFSPSGNSVTSIVDIDDGDCEYTIPVGETNNNKVSFPPITIDFSSSVYSADKLFTFNNKYPEFDGALDFKGGFSIKDTKYPPPRQSHAINFERKEQIMSIDRVVPKILMPATITGIFQFSSIVLTRVLDKTYTAIITLEDISLIPQYDVSDIYILPDSSSNNKSILVLAVKKSMSPKTTLVFNKPMLYILLGEGVYGMPVIIYDETITPASSLAWRDVGFKNATLYFD